MHAMGGRANASGAIGIPGNGEFEATIWLAAFVALLLAPGWPGFVALIAGGMVSRPSSPRIVRQDDGAQGQVVQHVPLDRCCLVAESLIYGSDQLLPGAC